MCNSIIYLRSIYDILGEKFYIPSYQRGYRWDHTQVEDLLNDIWQFCNKASSFKEKQFYCLQPIVVHQKDGYWHIVDGQQRLTTIRIILTFLSKEYLRGEFYEAYKKNIFSINYETRKDSFEKYLDEITEDKKDENIDFAHIYKAYETVSTWFKDKTKNDKDDFLGVLLAQKDEKNPVKVIWYDMTSISSDENYAVDVFTRINIGKISLTNAELIKALFLTKVDNRVKTSTDTNEFDSSRHLKQLQIANEWDSIENKLQDDKVWYYIWDQKIKYETRIEYIFDLISENDIERSDDNYFTFHKFNEMLEITTINDLWLRVKNLFQLFADWYEDPVFYHYIAYLITTGFHLRDIIDWNKDKTKTDFIEIIKEKIKETVNYQIEDLSYNKDSDKIRKVLLLFNIQVLLDNDKSNQRFPFELYKENNWDIEHIRSQKPETLEPGKQRPWLALMMHYFTGILEINSIIKTEIEERINGLEEKEKLLSGRIYLILSMEQINQDDFHILKDDLFQYFDDLGNHEDVEEPDKISNLALLDFATNRSYHNAPFPVKRKEIINRDLNGVFIPLGTKNVFLKGYSTKVTDLLSWGQSDAEEYLESINKVLSPIINNTKDLTAEALV